MSAHSLFQYKIDYPPYQQPGQPHDHVDPAKNKEALLCHDDDTIF